MFQVGFTSRIYHDARSPKRQVIVFDWKKIVVIVFQLHNWMSSTKKKHLTIAFILIEPSYPKKCDYFRVQRLGLFIQKQLACRAEEQ